MNGDDELVPVYYREGEHLEAHLRWSSTFEPAPFAGVPMLVALVSVLIVAPLIAEGASLTPAVIGLLIGGLLALRSNRRYFERP